MQRIAGGPSEELPTEQLERLKTKTFFPVVECRMTNVILGKRGTGPNTNFHIIFSNELDCEDIENFIKALEVGDRRISTSYSDATWLLNEAVVDFNRVCENLKNDGRFKGKYLIFLPYDEYGGIDPIDPTTHRLFKEKLVNSADILGSANKKQRDFFLWRDPKFTQEQYKDLLGRRIPCIKGSDSHRQDDIIGRLKDQNSKPTDNACWIKADPTFNGLRQILSEPDDRVYIGALPPKLSRVSDHPTYFLSRLQIRRLDGVAQSEGWFDADLPLNHDMIAVIGNKGSGKSALADIIGLAGDTSKAASFSFLENKKFRQKKLAAKFEVIATWADGSSTKRNLQNDPSPASPESVRYISQSYLDRICTETSAGEDSAFQKELRSVIFSHIENDQKLGKASLDDVIAFKTEEANRELDRLRLEMSQLNEKIAAMEGKAAPSHVAQLSETLEKKRHELAAHEALRPGEVARPDTLEGEERDRQAAIETEIVTQRTALSDLQSAIAAAQEQRQAVTAQHALAIKLDQRLTNIAGDFSSQKDRAKAEFDALGLDIDAIIRLTIDRKLLNTKLSLLANENAALDAKLAPDAPEGILQAAAAAQQKITDLSAQLDAPNRAYQAYLERLRQWDNRKNEIVGDLTRPESLKFIEGQLEHIHKALPGELAGARERRREMAGKIHQAISHIRFVYAGLFSSVQQLIDEEVVIKEGFKLSFASTIVQRGFLRTFFDEYVSQGVNGSFCGKDPGERRLNDLIEHVNFDDAAETVRFVEAIEQMLLADQRSAEHPLMDIGAQLRKHATIHGLYDFLWSFTYLRPEYSLKLDDKELSQLSPGERGALLLVFYLLVDRSDLPVIVDQPEENLDNQTVFHLLIPVIKAVKARRQIIMVTHNPNIAVVCDAEQIVHASISRKDGNRISYVSGSIENPDINKRILDVLEGTRPAFDNRDGKYHRL